MAPTFLKGKFYIIINDNNILIIIEWNGIVLHFYKFKMLNKIMNCIFHNISFLIYKKNNNNYIYTKFQ